MRWQHKYRTVWNKKTRGQAGIQWDRIVENVWKEIGGSQDEILSIDEGGVYKTNVRDMIGIWEKKRRGILSEACVKLVLFVIPHWCSIPPELLQ